MGGRIAIVEVDTLRLLPGRKTARPFGGSVGGIGVAGEEGVRSGGFWVGGEVTCFFGIEEGAACGVFLLIGVAKEPG